MDTTIITNLMHRISKKSLQGATLASRLAFQPRQQLRERLTLFTLGEDLQGVVVVADVLLVDGQHRQQHVE